VPYCIGFCLPWDHLSDVGSHYKGGPINPNSIREVLLDSSSQFEP
jgi:hypothetical protein